MRRHARGKMSRIRYGYANYFVKLEEGKPPQDYYEWRRTKKPAELLHDYIQKRRNESVPYD